MYFSWSVGCCRAQINVFDLAALLLLFVDRGGDSHALSWGRCRISCLYWSGYGEGWILFPSVDEMDWPTTCWRKPTADWWVVDFGWSQSMLNSVGWQFIAVAICCEGLLLGGWWWWGYVDVVWRVQVWWCGVEACVIVWWPWNVKCGGRLGEMYVRGK